MAPYGAKTDTLLPVMTLAFLFSLLTITLAVPVKREKRNYDPEEIYYMNGDIRCLRCPPGNMVLRPCTIEDTESTCAPCLPGHTFSEHLTGMSSCLPCTVCRADEEEVSPCTITKNAKCQCKKGTYCPPGAPCEVCQKCTTRCPPDLVIQTPCNSTSDAQCGPPETAIDTTAIIVPVVLVILTILVAVVIWFCRKKCSGNAGSRLIPKTPTGDTETPFLQVPKLHFKENITENEKNEVIAKTFNIFVDQVPNGEFQKFVRELGLNDNEIERAKDDNKGTYDKNYAMLQLLHQDKKFDVNIWLKNLCDIKKKKVAQDIADKLITDGLFERTT
ncbi:tumor necrosis factor receptor superfamily member 22-like isoform X2 [Hyla sarda]|uniref:tumor necrosis factor receptor superfamily member 22-like isoform X2 n=1 Tax=Hyla sarda TaxID=327740 RepID=UPI0024C26C8B|nr:tumor necrosis factor receptor superfamily member 22-like isoform X2 [Hyla sarda]